MPVPNSFANVTTSIPLSQLDANFNTPITLGNTAIQLGNTVTTLNNMTLANVTVTSGNVTITNVSVTTANVATANVTTSQILNYGTANGVAYLNASKSLTTGSSITFDGTNLSLATGKVTTSATGTSAGYQWGGTTVTSRLYDDGGGNIYLDIGAGASNATVPLIIRTKGGGVTWSNGTSTTMTLEAAGNLNLAAGNLVIGTSGKGIDFSATPGTGTSELLADYEEGTWTPSVGGNATYIDRYGTYTKIGNIVTCQFFINVNTLGTGSSTTLIGFPFTSANTGYVQTGCVSYYASLAVNTIFVSLYVQNNATSCFFVGKAASGATVDNGIGLFGNNTAIYGTVTYRVA